MKALQFAEYGPSDVLHVVDGVDEPHAGPAQIRIAVRAAGINPFEWKVRKGLMREMIPISFPSIPHNDVSGVVDEVGEGVTGVSVGDEVFGSAVGGGAAEFAVVKYWVAKPAGMSFEEAAGLPVVVETAGRALGLLGVSEGQTLLINGAAGGVGIAAVQLAKARGATVVGTASPRNHEFLRSLGAVPVTYGDGLVDRVRELVPSVDLALDAAGGGVIPDLITLTGVPNNVVSIADFTAPQFGARVTSGGGEAMRTLDEAADLYQQGRFTMPIEATFPLAEAAKAHDLSESGHVRGKVILTLP